MQLEIVTPESNLYKGEITSAIFPGSAGSFGILDGHAPIVATLKEGQIKVIVSANNTETLFDIKGGVVEVNNNKIIVLAE